MGPSSLSFGGVARAGVAMCSPFAPGPAEVLVPELRTAREREKTRVWKAGRSVAETRHGSVVDLHGLSYGRTELLVADMRLLEPDPIGDPRVGGCQ